GPHTPEAVAPAPGGLSTRPHFRFPVYPAVFLTLGSHRETKMAKNLYQKVFDRHVVTQLSSGQYQVLIGLHLVHEVTSPQAFALLRDRGLKVKFPHRTFATVDHIIPTEIRERQRPLQDAMAEEMLQAIENNTREHGVSFFGAKSGHQ